METGAGASRIVNVRHFDDPDDVIELDKLKSRIVTVGGTAVSHTVQEPGWRWSTHVKPVVNTEWCQARHVGVVLAGRLRILSAATGEEIDVAEGDVYDILPGHDGWVVGDEPWVTVDWAGVRSFIPTWDVLADRVIATLLFTDIVGSTDLARQMGDVVWGELAATHEERVRDTVARYRGREVKQTGDGVLAAFDSAARAVRCALALHQVANGLGLSIRAGVHTGEVEVTESDLRGLAVHEAARIMSLAGASEVWVSGTTRSLIEETGFNFEDQGEHELKGIATPRRLYRVVD